MAHFLTALLLCASTALAQPALTGAGSAGNGGRLPGFIYGVSSVFDVTNLLTHSNAFSSAPWTLAGGNGSAAPTLTANACTDPLGGNTGWQLHLPAVSAFHAFSLLEQHISTLTGIVVGGPSISDIYIKGFVGGEKLWVTTSPDFAHSTVVNATTSWQRFATTWNVTSTVTDFQIGVNLFDSAQSAQAAQDVCIYGAQVLQDTIEWVYVPTTTAAATTQVTLQSPVPFRDFSALAAYGGNPIIAQNTAAWNVAGTDSPSARLINVSGGVLYAPTENNNGTNWNALAIYTADPASPLVWTAPASPVITNSAGTFDDHYLLHPALTTECTGASWTMFYSAQTNNSVSSILYATASSPTGSWTKHSNSPVITGGGQALPTVLKIGATMYMHVALQNSGTTNSGTFFTYSTSPASDCVTWTLGGISLRSSTSDWDFANRQGILDPFVWMNSHGFCEMLYSAGNTSGGFHQSIGYAVSPGPNCTFWYKYQPAAVIVGIPSNYLGDAVALETGGTFYLFGAQNLPGTFVTQGVAYTMPDH